LCPREILRESVAAGASDGERVGGACGCDRQRSGCGADRFGKANDLFNGLTFHAQGDEQGGDLGIGTLAGQHLSHHVASFGAIE
jgi:hypothetical protein